MGSNSQSSSAHTAASEAIFSNSGQVQKRIRNYETTIVDTSDTVRVFPPLENDSDIDIPGVLESVTEISSQAERTANNKPVRFSTALVSFIIVITFSWSVYSLFFTVKRENLASDDVTPSDVIQTVETSSLDELKISADRLLASSAWHEQEINTFLYHWNKLGESQLQKVAKSSWYQLLEFTVKKHLKQQQTLAQQGPHIDDQSLLTLSLAMGITEQPGKTTQSTDKPSRYETLLAELTKELKQAEKISTTYNDTQESESALNDKLRAKYASPNQDQPEKIIPNATAQLKQTPRVVPEPQKLTPRKTDIIQTPKIKSRDIEAVIAKYKQAYEKGDLEMMATLFGATNQGSSEYQNVKSNFDSTFNNTVSRAINFYDVKTASDGGSAVIDGKFNSSAEFKNGKGIQYTVANMKLNVSKLGNELVINQINILDRKVNVVEKDRNLLTKSNGMLTAVDNKVSIPTAAELQDITTQLVSAYESGNLKQFISLFSPEIKTNDRIDLSGVKQDYEQLFSTTSDRQMFIQNLKWSDETIGAKGTGDLEVIILSNEGNPVYSMEGKIQIVAQKIDNKVKITHLYHIERAK